MAFDYTNLYPDTSGNGGYTKSWNYTTVTDSIATCSASGYFNKVATRLGIGDNIIIARVDAFDTRSRTALVEFAELFVTGISGGVVTTSNSTSSLATAASVALKANIASPTFTGVPAAPTAAPGTNTTQLATTAYADAIAALKANLASPTFTGTPAAPTAAVDTNTTQLATTAMVLGQAASATPGAVASAAAVGTSVRYARADHVHAGVSSIDTVTGATTISGLLARSSQDLRVLAASKAQQQTATSTVVAVTPSNQQDHPSAAKAWGYITYSGSTPTLASGYNVASVTRPGLGQTQITLTNAMASTNYVITPSTKNSASNSNSGTFYDIASSTVFVMNHVEGGSATDPLSIAFAVHGTN